MALASVRSPSPPWAGAAHRLVLHVCTSNPFYLISAGLFLAGLYASFARNGGDVETWALLSGLASYALLLAVTALLLVRFANAWDDLRTVLLLVVLMFLATSVTFDEILVLDFSRGIVYFLAGLLFAILVSEGLLRGIRLRLPAWFRLPYYLILTLFFLYPIGLAMLEPPVGVAAPPRAALDDSLQWALFGFSPIAGLAFLTLLPAIRRGPAYVRGNGSPWPWPLYPWTLFGLLGLAVPARSFLLCYSMHLLDGPDHGRLIFGPYFVVPFGLCATIVLLELGLVLRSRPMLGVAIGAPLGLAVLAMLGHRDDPVYQEFLTAFTQRLGATPVYLTLLAAAGFYGYAALRRAPGAFGHLTASLAALAFVGPSTVAFGDLTAPQLPPLLAAAALQLTLGIVRRHAWHSLLGAVGLAVVVTVALPGGPVVVPWRGAMALHLVVLAVLVVGAAFRDDAGELLRAAGTGILGLACVTVALGGVSLPISQLPWWVILYPPSVALLLAGYGRLVGPRGVWARRIGAGGLDDGDRLAWVSGAAPDRERPRPDVSRPGRVRRRRADQPGQIGNAQSLATFGHDECASGHRDGRRRRADGRLSGS